MFLGVLFVTFADFVGEGYVLIGVYLFIYMSVCDSHNLKTTGPNLMKFDMIFGHGPRTTPIDFYDDPDPDPDFGSGFFLHT